MAQILTELQTFAWTNGQSFDLNWNLTDQLLHFDLQLEADTWFALIFGDDDNLEHDMILWKVESKTAETEEAEIEYVSTAQDSLWLGLDDTKELHTFESSLVYVENSQNLNIVLDGEFDAEQNLFKFQTERSFSTGDTIDHVLDAETGSRISVAAG